MVNFCSSAICVNISKLCELQEHFQLSVVLNFVVNDRCSFPENRVVTQNSDCNGQVLLYLGRLAVTDQWDAPAMSPLPSFILTFTFYES